MSDFSLPWFTENSRIIIREVEHYCSDLSANQLNWKSSTNKWSIGQCLEHMMNTNQSFIPTFNDCSIDSYKLPYRWLPWFPQKIGAKLLSEMAPGGKPMFSPLKWKPKSKQYSTAIVTDFIEHQVKLKNAIECLGHIDFKNQIIASPAFRMIHYNMSDVLQMLIFHEQRHLDQIKRTLSNVYFPAK